MTDYKIRFGVAGFRRFPHLWGGLSAGSEFPKIARSNAVRVLELEA